MAAVRPLTMPDPPPLISSTKPGGSITQVERHADGEASTQSCWHARAMIHRYDFSSQGTPVQLHSPAHGLDHGKMPPTQMGVPWMDQRKMGE